MTQWNQARVGIDLLIQKKKLQQVAASREVTDTLIAAAKKHVATTESAELVELDPVAAFQMLYDAARKAMSSLLAVQGLRSRGPGGHETVITALRLQFEPPALPILTALGWMRPLRNSSEYPDGQNREADEDDYNQALPHVKEMLLFAEKWAALLPPYSTVQTEPLEA